MAADESMHSPESAFLRVYGTAAERTRVSYREAVRSIPYANPLVEFGQAMLDKFVGSKLGQTKAVRRARALDGAHLTAVKSPSGFSRAFSTPAERAGVTGASRGSAFRRSQLSSGVARRYWS